MRDYGITNIAPAASAPAVGLAGDTYFDTVLNQVFISNGTVWLPVGDATPLGITVGNATANATPALNALLTIGTVYNGPSSWLAGSTVTLPVGSAGLYLIELDLSYRSDTIAGIYWEIANGSGASYSPDMQCRIAHTVSTINARYQSSFLRQCADGDGFQVRYRGNTITAGGYMQVVRLSLLRIGDSFAP